MDVITTLQAHIDTYLSKQDFGYLPPNLCMMGLASQMNKNARARVRDVLPRVARRLAWEQDGWHPSTPEIQGYHLPLVFRIDTPRNRIHYDYAGSRTPERRVEGRDVNPLVSGDGQTVSYQPHIHANTIRSSQEQEQHRCSHNL